MFLQIILQKDIIILLMGAALWEPLRKTAVIVGGIQHPLPMTVYYTQFDGCQFIKLPFKGTKHDQSVNRRAAYKP